MTALDPRPALRSISIAVVIVAVALGFNTIRTLGTCSSKLKEYVSYAEEAGEAEKAAARSAAAVAMFDSLPDPRPVPLADLLKKSLSGDKYEIVERPAEPTIEGWQATRREVTLPEIQLARLGDFLAVVETQRPPWRLVSCKITPTGSQGGMGRVSLTLDALEKQPK
ncbi:MAG: hypothetical protein WCL44_09540 [bacterium]